MRITAPVLPARAELTPWVQAMARFGYAAKGVVYVLVGYIAARAAFAAGRPMGAAGALRELLRNGGRWLLLVVAAGLAAHSLWRLVQAARDPEHHDGKLARRFFYLLSAGVYASLTLSAVRLWQGRPGADPKGQRMLTAELLGLPFGELFVALLGIGVIGYAVHQIVTGARGHLAETPSIAEPQRRRVVLAIGRVGTVARGIVLGVAGVFFIQAARHHDPSAAGGTEEVLRSFGSGWLLGIVAAGLFAYGVFQLANALYRRVPVR